jgi:hypothetical protein
MTAPDLPAAPSAISFDPWGQERWFRQLTDQALRRGVFRSVPDLIDMVEEYLAAHNAKGISFHNARAISFAGTAATDQTLS